MSPEKARVFVAEDHQSQREIITEYLEDAEHTVVAHAENLPQAVDLIKRFRELNIQVAVLDSNLRQRDLDGSDGRTMLALIRELAPHVKTVGMSNDPFPGVDYDLGKSNKSQLGEVVNKL
jgi:CheY-like chemotaxis protein